MFIAELERQVLAGTVTFNAVLACAGKNSLRARLYRNETKPAVLLRIARQIVADAYAKGLLPERHWPPVELPAIVTSDGVHFITDPCPYCGKRHTHGAGGPGKRVLWGSRVPHCRNLPHCYGQYVLVPKGGDGGAK